MPAPGAFQSRFGELLARHGRILTFRATPQDYDSLGLPDLAWGFLWVWVAGIGRSWDQPQVAMLRRTGIGSVLYVCVLAMLLMLVIAPLRPTRAGVVWRILPFLSLTAPPALLYALPVERWFGVEVAGFINLWLLTLVAGWRVAMYVRFLARGVGFSPGLVFTASLLPLMGIVASLAALNLDRAVFEIMAFSGTPRTSNDDAYLVVLVLTFLSIYAFIPMLLFYLVQVVLRWKAALGKTSDSSETRL